MNLQTRALAIAAGLGGLFQSVFAIIATILVNQSLASLLNSEPAAGFLAQFGSFVVGALLLQCLGWLADVAIGFLYAYFHRQTAPLERQDGRVGGAISSGIARLLGASGYASRMVLLMPTAFADTVLSESDVIAFGSAACFVGGPVVLGLVLGAAGGALGATRLRGEKRAY